MLVLLPWLHWLRIRLIDAVDPHKCVPARHSEHISRRRKCQSRHGIIGTGRHLQVLLTSDLGRRRDIGRRGGRSRPTTPPACTGCLKERHDRQTLRRCGTLSGQHQSLRAQVTGTTRTPTDLALVAGYMCNYVHAPHEAPLHSALIHGGVYLRVASRVEL